MGNKQFDCTHSGEYTESSSTEALNPQTFEHDIIYISLVESGDNIDIINRILACELDFLSL